MRVAIYTLGCKMNQYETQAMEQLLRRKGHQVVDFSQEADAYVVNTCSVTAVSDQKSRKVLHRVRRERPGAVLAVCGCYPQTHVEDVRKLDVDLIAGTGDRAGFVDLLEQAVEERRPLELVDRCLRGDELRPRDAVRLLPSRDQCVSLWRALQHAVPPDGLETDYLPLLRRLSGALQGAEPFLRTVLCLEVFRERGLLQCRRLGDSINLHLTSQGKKVALDRSEYLLRLHQALDAAKGGAR